MIKVFIDDGERYKNNSGYGNLSRNFGLALSKAGCKVYYKNTLNKPWDLSITSNTKESFTTNVRYGNPNNCDIALSITTPKKRIINNIPNVLYTQNALHGLKKNWGTSCSNYDAVIVPGNFDKLFFSDYNENIFVCPQIVNNKIFRNRKEWRKEGSKKFSFLYIGSFSYRKGVDLLIESFCKFSASEGNTSKLIMICPNAKNINYLLKNMRSLNPYSDIDLYVDDFSQEWICRHINRSDAFVTLSRGEGWCMPVFESMLCEKPVIAPSSTAMSEATPNGSIIRMPTKKVFVKTLSKDFAKGFQDSYGEDQIASYDVDISSAINAFSDMKEKYKIHKHEVSESRKYILSNYSFEKIGHRLKAILDANLKSPQK